MGWSGQQFWVEIAFMERLIKGAFVGGDEQCVGRVGYHAAEGLLRLHCNHFVDAHIQSDIHKWRTSVLVTGVQNVISPRRYRRIVESS